MKNRKCYNCEKEITKVNESEEHIISNALGGHSTSIKLLCQSCNEEFGNTIDKEIEDQLGFVVVALGIKCHREKKKPEIIMQTKAGSKKKFGKGLKTYDRLVLDLDDYKELDIQPGKLDETVVKLLKQLKEKYPNAQYQESIEAPPAEKYHLSNTKSGKPGDLYFGGKSYSRAVAKIALNYYLAQDLPIEFCTELRDFVKGDSDINPVYHFYPGLPIHNLDDDEVSHVLHICGSKKSGVIYAYVELFNIQNLLVVISKKYDGEDFESTYAYDLLENKVVTKLLRINLTRQHINDLEIIEQDKDAKANELLRRLSKIIQKNQLRDDP